MCVFVGGVLRGGWARYLLLVQVIFWHTSCQAFQQVRDFAGAHNAAGRTALLSCLSVSWKATLLPLNVAVCKGGGIGSPLPVLPLPITHTRTHTHAHTRTHARTHTHTHMHTKLLSTVLSSEAEGFFKLVFCFGHGC